ncbi:MAG TPA: hypothetical protein VFC23_08510 [Thermoanaerobaculia bacterium]|nr:hypothetical protein [Thermoanaerobaculia bacterium]
MFADKEQAKQGSLLIDTVFHVEAVHIWDGGHPPCSLPASMLARGHQAFKRHLRFGMPGQSNHTGSYTYSAAKLKRFGGSGSFIPIGESGEKISIPFSLLRRDLQVKLDTHLRYRRLPPILLTREEIGEILELTWERTSHAVTSIQEAGGRTRDQIANKNCVKAGC